MFRIPWFFKVIFICTSSAARRFFGDKLSNHAGAAAYFFLFSLFPASLLCIAIVDAWLSHYGIAQERFFSMLTAFNPSLNRDFFEAIGLQSVSFGGIGVVGIAGLLWTSRLGYASVQAGLNVVFPARKKVKIILSALQSLLLVPILLTVLIATILIGYAWDLIIEVIFWIATMLPPNVIPIERIFAFLYSMVLRHAIDTAIPFLSVFFIAFLMYRFIPDSRPANRSAAFGALSFAIAFMVMKFLFGSLFSLTKLNMIYGSIASLILIMMFVHLTFVLFFFSAEMAYIHEKLPMIGLENLIMERKVRGFSNWDYLHRSPFRLMLHYGVNMDEQEEMKRNPYIADTVCYILEGELEIYSMQNGTKILISKLHSGEMISVSSMDTHFGLTAKASADTIVLAIDKKEFESMVLDTSANQTILNIIHI